MSKRRRTVMSAPVPSSTAGKSQPVGKSEDSTPTEEEDDPEQRAEAEVHQPGAAASTVVHGARAARWRRSAGFGHRAYPIGPSAVVHEGRHPCASIWAASLRSALAGRDAAWPRWRRASRAQDRSGDVSFMVFGDPAELAAYQSLVAAFEEGHPEIERRAHPHPQPVGLPAAPGCRLRGRGSGRRRAHQLPPLRAVRGHGRAGAAGAVPASQRRHQRQRLLPGGDRSLPLAGPADVHPPEHQQPRRLLQPRSLRRRRSGLPRRRLDLGCVPRRGQGPDAGPRRRRGRPTSTGWAWNPRSSAWRRSSGRTAASWWCSSRACDPSAWRSTRGPRARRSSGSWPCRRSTAWCPTRWPRRPRAARAASSTGAPRCSSTAAGARPRRAASMASTGTWRRCPGACRRPAILHADAYCMAAATQDKDAAWTFIEFANSPAGPGHRGAHGANRALAHRGGRVGGVPRPRRGPGQQRGVARDGRDPANRAGDGRLGRHRGADRR